jgi:hypothetical protein
MAIGIDFYREVCYNDRMDTKTINQLESMRDASNAAFQLYAQFGRTALKYSLGFEIDGQEKSIGHIQVPGVLPRNSILGNPVVDFMRATSNQSVAVIFNPPKSYDMFAGMSKCLYGDERQEQAADLCRDNLFIYYKDSDGDIAEWPVMLDKRDLNRDTVKQYNISNLTDAEYSITMLSIAAINAQKRIRQIEQYDVINGSYKTEKAEIETCLKALSGSPILDEVARRLAQFD